MGDFLNSPFFYIVLIGVGVLIYVILSDIFKRRKKKGKGKSKNNDKADDSKKDNAKEEVVAYEKFNSEPTTSSQEFAPLTDDDVPIKSFEEQALDFLSDEENEKLFEEFFGTSTSDLFSDAPISPFDYSIPDYNYDLVWEQQPKEISFDYNYDVNYVPPKKKSKVKKQFQKMNKAQKAIVVSNIFNNKKFKTKF